MLNTTKISSSFSKTIQVNQFEPETIKHDIERTIPGTYPANRRVYENIATGLELEQSVLMQFASKGLISAPDFDNAMTRIIDTKKQSRELLKIKAKSLVFVQDGQVIDCLLFESEELLKATFERVTGSDYENYVNDNTQINEHYLGTKVFNREWHDDPNIEITRYV